MTTKCREIMIGDKVMRVGMLHCELIWGIPVKTLFGDSTEVNATIREIDLLGHRIVLVATGTGD